MQNMFFGIGVLCATLARIAIGMMWYSQALFGNMWLRSAQVKPDEGKMRRAIVGETLLSLLMALVMACFVHRLGVHSIASGFHVGWMSWLGFVLPIGLQGVLWANYPLVLFALNMGNNLVSMVVMGAILGFFL